MPVQIDGQTATLTDSCDVSEVLSFAEWLLATDDAEIDASAATHLHTSFVQTILFHKPKIKAPPTDEFLNRLLENAQEVGQ